MKLKEISLENFRGFAGASIEVKPLTVLLGANSSGKSSFGHALAAMAHAQWAQSASTRATLSAPPQDAENWPVDLGSLDDLRHHGASGPVRVGLLVDREWVRWGFGEDPSSGDLANLSLSEFEFPIGGSPGSAAAGSDISAVQVPTTAQAIAASGSQFVGSVPAPVDKALFKRLGPFLWHSSAENQNVQITFEGLVPSSILHLGGTSVLLNNVVRNEVLSTLEHLVYLRATRTRPVRAYGSAASGIRQAIGYSGEWTAALLDRRAKDTLTILVPPDRKKQTAGAPWKKEEQTLESAVDFWLRSMELASSVRSVPRQDNPARFRIQVELIKGQPHDITEVGFGVSQVLPVVVAGLLMPREGLLVVDLPEAHLHPRPQADLGIFFCSLALSGRTSLVETHSEMFINQLRLQVAANPELAEMIAVYFIDQPDHRGRCSKPKRIKIGQGDELRWPSGFMQEGWEIETRIQKMYEQQRTPAE